MLTNYFYSRIQCQYRAYRGVSTKYINRYCSLFSIQKQYTGSDDDELVVLLMNRLRNINDTFYIRQISYCDICSIMSDFWESHHFAGEAKKVKYLRKIHLLINNIKVGRQTPHN